MEDGVEVNKITAQKKGKGRENIYCSILHV